MEIHSNSRDITFKALIKVFCGLLTYFEHVHLALFLSPGCKYDSYLTIASQFYCPDFILTLWATFYPTQKFARTVMTQSSRRIGKTQIKSRYAKYQMCFEYLKQMNFAWTPNISYIEERYFSRVAHAHTHSPPLSLSLHSFCLSHTHTQTHSQKRHEFESVEQKHIAQQKQKQ